MNSNKGTARIAGLLYLVAILAGIFSLRYVPSRIIVWDNAELTYTNIIEHEMLFWLGIVAGIIGYTAFFILPIVLYKLLNPVNKSLAVGMVSLAVVSVPFSFANLLYKVNILTLIDKQEYLKSLGNKLQAELLLNLHFYDNGLQIASVFWGLWFLPFGYLVFRSGFLPKILGILLMAGCFGYLINFIGGFLFQEYSDLGISRFGSLLVCLTLKIRISLSLTR